MASLFRIAPPMDDQARLRCDALMKRVENACSEMLLSPNWSLNMQIVDELNQEKDPVVVIEVVRVLRKKLGSGNVRTLGVGLTLAETLVKNCGAPVHHEVASERFMAAVAKIARTHSFKTTRESMAVADQSLDIIQAWGEAFLPRRREFPLFVETYHELRAEGLPFSEQYQSDRPPVLDPGKGSLLDRPAGTSAAGNSNESQTFAESARAAALGGNASAGAGGRGDKPAGGGGGAADAAPTPAEMHDLSVSDREIVSTAVSCAEMLDQVVRAAESRAEVKNSDITSDIAQQLQQTTPKLVGILEAHGEGDAGMVDAVFKVMEAAESALRLYRDVMDGSASVPILPPSSFSATVGTISNGMSNLSMDQAASAKAAASKLRGKNVPTLSRPPGHSRKKSSSSSSSKEKSADLGVDLLSGFELEGASNSKTNTSVVQSKPAATPADDMFAAFAVPPTGGVDNSNIVGNQAGQQQGGGFAMEFGPPNEPQQQHQEDPQVANIPQGPPSRADKAKSLMDNLSALYATNNSSAGGQGGSAMTGGGGGMRGVGGAMVFPGYSGGGVLGAGGTVGGSGGEGAQGMNVMSAFDGVSPLADAQEQQQQQQPQQPFSSGFGDAGGYSQEGNSSDAGSFQPSFQGGQLQQQQSIGPQGQQDGHGQQLASDGQQQQPQQQPWTGGQDPSYNVNMAGGQAMLMQVGQQQGEIQMQPQEQQVAQQQDPFPYPQQQQQQQSSDQQPQQPQYPGQQQQYPQQQFFQPQQQQQYY